MATDTAPAPTSPVEALDTLSDAIQRACLSGGDPNAKPNERWSMMWHMGRFYCTHAAPGMAIGIAMEMAITCAEVDRHGY